MIYVSVRMEAGNSAQAGALVSKGLSALGTTFRVGFYTNESQLDNYLNFVSVMATEDDTIVTFDDSTNNSITIATENLGIGDYEFAIKKQYEFMSSFQDEPYFEHLSPGIYTIYIQDKNNCGIAQIAISVVGFPKFFTPNNDGYNDTWEIIGVNENFYTTSNIYIFDRFGKLITQINPTERGWNGLFNGQQLPSTDYWFSAELIDNEGNIRIRKGHFSLIRK